MTRFAVRAGRLLCATLIGLAVTTGALAQEKGQTGTTHLRLDAVDVKGAAKGDFVFFASFLDKYAKPVSVAPNTQWMVSFDGEPASGTFDIKTLRESDQPINLVIVLGAVTAVGDEAFEASAKGSIELLNALRENDLSAVVAYTDTPEATDALSPAHGEGVDWIKEREASGLTPPLYEAIEKALELFPTGFDTIGPNRAMIVVTDGADKDQEDVRKVNDRIKTLQSIAKDRNVRIGVLGINIANLGQLEKIRQLATSTGGTVREAITAAEITTYLGNFESELRGQYVVKFNSMDFDDEKEVAFKLEINHGGQGYASKPKLRFVGPKESHLWTYVAIAGGGLLGLILLIVIIRAIARAIAAGRDDGPIVEGPDLRTCGQCNNQIPVDWKVCQYCEALPHYGRLTVIDAAKNDDLYGRVWFIKDNQVNIGSAGNNQVVFDEPSVSKRHAGIKVQDNRFELADYGSTNGTRVGDVRLGKQFLKDGDEISFGAVKVEFKLKK